MLHVLKILPAVVHWLKITGINNKANELTEKKGVFFLRVQINKCRKIDEHRKSLLANIMVINIVGKYNWEMLYQMGKSTITIIFS